MAVTKGKPAKKKSAARRPRNRVPAASGGKISQTQTHSQTPAPTDADSRWKPQKNEVGIRVRMYRVGFGDFFLITFQPDHGDQVHVIVDCGVFKGRSGTGDLGSIQLAVNNMQQLTDKKIALIIVTHRHADHIAGFGRCQSTFESLDIQAVWMSIWESQYSTAQKYQAQLTKTAAALRTHFNALGLGASKDEVAARQYTENATGEKGKGSNDNALKFLKSIKGAPPSYYQAGQIPTLPSACVEAGIGAKILGPPPIADVQLMKLMNLQKGVGQYLTAVSGGDSSTTGPFGDHWDLGRHMSYDPLAFFEWFKGRKRRGRPPAKRVRKARKAMEVALAAAQPDAAMAAAAQLNDFLNNQSLVVLFTFKGKNLLFVGDAQAGNWEHWIFGTDAPDKAAAGAITPAAQSILTSLDFYKVGHHGSGNATPRAVVNAMAKAKQRFAAMCSTEKGVYGKENLQNPTAGTEVPRDPLMSALEGVSTLVRSDQHPITVKGQEKPAMDDAPIPPEGGGARFETGDYWIDCFL